MSATTRSTILPDGLVFAARALYWRKRCGRKSMGFFVRLGSKVRARRSGGAPAVFRHLKNSLLQARTSARLGSPLNASCGSLISSDKLFDGSGCGRAQGLEAWASQF